MMDKFIFYTQAYNAEKTIKRTIESILTQTYDDFIYYVLNNGSTDRTETIITKYAKQDNRIVLLRNKTNNVWPEGDRWLGFLNQYSEDCFFSMLDADDEYKTDFLEKMLSFMEEYNLEVAACGNDFIDTKTNRITGIRRLEHHLILEGDGFGRHFHQYYQFMRTVWGKVYSLSVLRKHNPYSEKRISYGSDTLFAMAAFLNTERVGILADSLHKYYISPKSVSHQFDDKRIDSDQIIFDASCYFLNEKCGTISQDHLDFLYHIYLIAVKDTVNVLVNSQISDADKLGKLREVFQNKRAQELVRWPGTQEEKNKFCNQIGSWLLAREGVKAGTDLEKAADILAAIRTYPIRNKGWHDGQLFLLMTIIKEKSAANDLNGNVDAQIEEIASKSPVLFGFDAGFLSCYRDIVYSILQPNEIKALEQIEDIIAREEDIPEEYIVKFLELGLRLSTKLEYANDFIYFKKLQVSILIDLFCIGEAREQLADWDEILPDDMEFKALRERLMP